ncbi:MAG TPA: GDSL-type esterase/lipase family protein [Abditibacterium sp.]|jgi:lysophospholipase L1-like esterase
MKTHHKLSSVALFCSAVVAGTACSASAETIDILPIGDSITQGGLAGRPEYTYRHPLFYKLKEAGYDVNFIGSLRTGLAGDFKWPDKNGVAFDLDHEGHYGWKTAAVRDKLPEWSASWGAVPDIAIIHLGTNDRESKDFNADVAQPLKDMVTFLRTKNPRVAVLIGHLNFNDAQAVTIRNLVDAAAKEISTKESPVMTVATYEGWNPDPAQAESDTFDWAHPNERGQVKLADKWLAAMKPLLVSFAGTATAVQPVAAQTAPKSTWAFTATRDTFAPTAFFDARSLNEKVAGQSGFVRVDKDGHFVRGDGQPLRFWGVVSDNQKPIGEGSDQEKRNLEHHARWLAKRGVNIARTLVDITPRPRQGWGAPNSDDPSDVNRVEMDGIWRYVATMKKEGIYSLICPYWALTVKPPKSWGVDIPEGKDAHNALYFDPKMRALYKNWLRIMLTEKNPYTGIPLKDDPALAILQLQNEDSLLFWTFDTMSDSQKRVLGAQYGAWLAKKYGSLDATQKFWATGDKASAQNAAAVTLPGDDAAQSVFMMYPTWEFVQSSNAVDGKSRRKADQMEFLATTMREFNADIGNYVRSLGAKCLINSTNWRPADTLRMGDAERWSYAANPVLAVNRYTGSVHEGKDNGWAIRSGDFYNPSWSQLKDPAGFPLTLKPTLGSPMLITESSWTPPTLNRAEGSFLVSAYGSLTGIGPYFFFALGNDEWAQPASANGYDKDSLFKWSSAQPDELGQFPAAAWLARLGYVQEAKPVVVEQRSLEDLWTQRLPLIAEEAGFDPNRDTGSISPRSNVKTFVDPLAYFVGPVRTVYGGDPTKNYVHPQLNTLIDRKNQTVRSVTGELTLDYGKGISVLNAPKAQGVTGFLKAGGGKFATRNLQITTSNDYASLLVVSLDQLPLNTSKKVLLQVGTTARPTGWQEKPATRKIGEAMVSGAEVVSIGRAPWQVQDASMTVSIANASLKRARLLDVNMMPIKDVPVRRAGNNLQIVLPPNALYIGLD